MAFRKLTLTAVAVASLAALAACGGGDDGGDSPKVVNGVQTIKDSSGDAKAMDITKASVEKTADGFTFTYTIDQLPAKGHVNLTTYVGPNGDQLNVWLQTDIFDGKIQDPDTFEKTDGKEYPRSATLDGDTLTVTYPKKSLSELPETFAWTTDTFSDDGSGKSTDPVDSAPDTQDPPKHEVVTYAP